MNRNDGYRPEGWPAVVPRIFVADAPGLIDFMRTVFGATGEDRHGPAEIWIGDSVVLVSDDSARGKVPACLYVYAPDADACFGRAVAAGAEVVEPPIDMPYGDRRATVRDRWGNLWQIATRRPG